MKKISLLILLVGTVLVIQSCKKSSSDSSTTDTTTYVLEATVNATTWTPDTLSANITYNAAAKTKVFNFTGNYLRRQVTCAVTIPNAPNTTGFPIGANTINAAGNPVMTYAEQQNVNGSYVFVPVITAGTGEGSVVVSAVDSVKNVITGTFSFTSKKANYDSSGNVVSITNVVVSGGTFTNMPYTYISQ